MLGKQFKLQSNAGVPATEDMADSEDERRARVQRILKMAGEKTTTLGELREFRKLVAAAFRPSRMIADRTRNLIDQQSKVKNITWDSDERLAVAFRLDIRPRAASICFSSGPPVVAHRGKTHRRRKIEYSATYTYPVAKTARRTKAPNASHNFRLVGFGEPNPKRLDVKAFESWLIEQTEQALAIAKERRPASAN